MLESQHAVEDKLICEGIGKDFHRVRDRERIPPFEAMLNPEQRKALYSGTEMPKDRKGLGYQYQVMMVTVASPEDSPRPSESRDKDFQIEKDDETVEPTQSPPRSKKEVKPLRMSS